MEDVDPCETVEYVLPLLNSLGTDEGEFFEYRAFENQRAFAHFASFRSCFVDEAVREALAPGLHKILWFFYSVSFRTSSSRLRIVRSTLVASSR